jgi:hypothetical protein
VTNRFIVDCGSLASVRNRSTEEVSGFRLRRHHLLDQPPANPVAICRDVCGVQAQVMSAAYLQLWARNHALRRGEIENTLWKERALVKTSLMRQTLHFIPTDEFPLYISALRSSRRAGVLRVMARCGISEEDADAMTPVILRTLGNGPCKRAEIVAALRPKANKAVRFWLENSWGLVRLPVADGLVCYGSGENNEANFIRVDQWLPKVKMKLMPAAEAQRALLRKYLQAYGPATLADFSHWAGIPMSEVKEVGPQVDGGIIEISSGKRPLLMLGEDVADFEKHVSSKSIRLLPSFDVYLLAHREKDHLLGDQHYKRVYRNQGWISPVVLINGAVAGVWAYKPRGRKLEINIEPFGKLSKSERASIEHEVEELGKFFGSEVSVRFQ